MRWAEDVNQLAASGLIGGAIDLEPFGTLDAIDAARLRPLTRSCGLSLTDRACLALARRLGAPAVTADTAWSDIDLDLELTPIR